MRNKFLPAQKQAQDYGWETISHLTAGFFDDFNPHKTRTRTTVFFKGKGEYPQGG
jgi:hypothetical protein